MANAQPQWSGHSTVRQKYRAKARPTNNASLSQIVVTRLRDGRYRIVCFDGHGVVDELATEDLNALFEFKDRLQSIRGWEPGS